MDLVGTRIIDMGEWHYILYMCVFYVTMFTILFDKVVFSPSIPLSCKGEGHLWVTELWGNQFFEVRTFWHRGQLRFVYVTLKLIPETKPIELSAVKLSNKQFRKPYYTIHIICLGFFFHLEFFSHLALHPLYSSVHSSFFLFHSALFF